MLDGTHAESRWHRLYLEDRRRETLLKAAVLDHERDADQVLTIVGYLLDGPLGDWDEESLVVMVTASQGVLLHGHATLFHAGDPSEHAIYVLKGAVCISDADVRYRATLTFLLRSMRGLRHMQACGRGSEPRQLFLCRP